VVFEILQFASVFEVHPPATFFLKVALQTAHVVSSEGRSQFVMLATQVPALDITLAPLQV
jgi:hypothetical protein